MCIRDRYNHSSFCAGREVICAGLIRINKGDITYISNESGHYTPPPTQLANAIQILAEEYDIPMGETLTEIEINGGVRFDNLASFLAAHPAV